MESRYGEWSPPRLVRAMLRSTFIYSSLTEALILAPSEHGSHSVDLYFSFTSASLQLRFSFTSASLQLYFGFTRAFR